MAIERARPYLVFAQRAEPTLDVAAWDAHVRRFFGERLVAEGAGGAGLALVASGASLGARIVRARLATEADVARAAEAEALAGGGGLATLARRCPVVLEVEREAPDDPVALRLAAALAGAVLGPVLDPDRPELLGAKTARGRYLRS